jgi:predicted nucleotide-binding protein/ActR/RegA family two-component response regulator
MDGLALIVDNDGVWRDLLARAIGRIGLRCDSASTPEFAIDLVRNNRYTIALLDADLGNEQGPYGCSEILSELKATGSEIPVIIVSGIDDVRSLTAQLAQHYSRITNFAKGHSLLELDKILRDLLGVSTTKAMGHANTGAKAAAGLQRTSRRKVVNRSGSRVFIGHGRSPAWRELKDFVQDRLKLPWDEFNRMSAAGVSNIARLSEMLDAAAVALLIMTAEDETADGFMQARLNVIHEAGLFQGRLGFSRAVVLLEEGCAEFGNIKGLGQIQFPKGNITASFEEVRRALER